MSAKIKISSILLTLFIATGVACSLHYNQQADSQTLDIEVMRPVTTAQPPNIQDP